MSTQVVYSFAVDAERHPRDIATLITRHVDDETAHDCIKQWTLAGAGPSRYVVVLHWSNGGWRRGMLSGENARSDIVLPLISATAPCPATGETP